MFGRKIMLFMLVLLPINQYARSAMHTTAKEHMRDIEAPHRAMRENMSITACCSWQNDLSAIEQILCTMQRSTACAAIPLSSSTTLATPSTVYCLTQDVGFIIIDAPDITLLMNGHSINEFLIINSSAPRAIVQNGKILAAAPASNGEAATASVQIMEEADNTLISECLIQPMGTTALNVDGRVGLNNAASNVVITHCVIYGGESGPADSVVPFGGIGLVNSITAKNSTIIDCFVAGGNGSTSTNGTISSGHGGIGILTRGASTICHNLFVQGGDGGRLNNVTTPNIADGITMLTGNGRNAIELLGSSDSIITDSYLVGGSGGNAITGGSIATNGGVFNTGSGGSGIFISDLFNMSIKDCHMESGTSGSVAAGGDIANNGNLVISAAGKGIFINSGVNIEIEQSIIRGLEAGSITTSTGTVGNNGGNVQIGNGGDGVYVNEAGTVFIDDCTITSDATGSISATSNAFSPGTVVIENVTTGTGGTGLFFTASASMITAQSTTIQSGDGGFIFASTGDISATVFAGNGGEGIHIAGTQTTVTNIILSTQQGGGLALGAPLTSNLGTGGNGGNGVTVTELGHHAIIDNVTIVATGDGGNVTNGGGADGTAGSGGTGIFIDSSVNNAQVHDCSINHTGSAGIGTIAGTNGQAINDLGTGSAIFSNMAIYIAAAPEYTLNLGSAIDTPNGTNFFAVGNDHPLANIYK